MSISKSTKDKLISKFQDDIYKINHEIRDNTRTINNLSDKQRMLKRAKHELTQLINKINGF